MREKIGVGPMGGLAALGAALFVGGIALWRSRFASS
jgi:hypothetical protein